MQAHFAAFPESQYKELTLENEGNIEGMSCSVSKASGLAVTDKCFASSQSLSHGSKNSITYWRGDVL